MNVNVILLVYDVRNQAQHERWKENVQELKQYEAERQELLGRIERLSKMTAGG